jgi:hypothetical protein
MTIHKSPGDHLGLFKLLVHGAAFDVDRYLATTQLPVDLVFHPADQPRGRPPDSYWHGFSVRLGGLDLDAEQQAIAAARFLESHRAALAALADFDAPTRLVVLSPELHCRPCLTARALDVPRALAVPAADLGFVVSFALRLCTAENIDYARSWMSATRYADFVRELDPEALRELARKIEREQARLAG